MEIDQLHQYCLAKPGVTESFPFDQHTLVFKVMGKMFALIGLDKPDLSINLKCDPQRAIDLRDLHPEGILPGYHMNKAHWNTVRLQAGLPERLITELIDHSYELVDAGLPRKVREALDEKSEGSS